MKYALTISGGFAGLTRTYEGDIALQEDVKRDIIEYLSDSTQTKNTMVRDAMQYHIKLEDTTTAYEAYFTDPNIPEAIRVLINDLKKTTS